MNASFESSANSPAIYRIRFMPSELTNAYKNILSDVSVNAVYESFCKYVTTSIEPVGWRAIWRAKAFTGLSIKYDFEVEVMDVLHNSLEAVAVVLNLISPNEHELTAEQFDEKERLLKDIKIVNIPLIQLYVISDNDSDQQYYGTALIIEHIRFFYKNLWRPWDELANSDGHRSEIFVETKLEPRLDLSFDMKDKIIPKSTINKVNNLLSEAWIIKKKIDSIDTTNGCEDGSDAEDKSDVEDHENYINETDLMEALRLKLRLDDIEREMKLLEDKHLRIIASNLKQNGDNSFGNEDQYLSSDGKPQNRIHLITKSFTIKAMNETFAKLSTKTNELETPVMFHKDIGNAVRCAKSGDKIYVMPGLYSCAELPWIENEIEIMGFGETEDEVVLQSNDSAGDIFMNCNSSELKFSGITLRSSSEMQCLIMIHSGCVVFNNCILDGSNFAKNTLIVLSKAKVELNESQVRNECGDGIVWRKGSVVIKNSVNFANKPNDRMEVEEDMNENSSAQTLVES